MTEASGPVPVADPAAGAGPSSSRFAGDLGRALAVGVLAGGSALAPDAAILLAPFAPALVAIRLRRGGAGAARFLVLSLIFSLAIASGAMTGALAAATAVFAVVALVVVLGYAHERASRPDPVEAGAQPEAPLGGAAPVWPEPRLTSGFSLALGAWIAVVVVLVALLAPVVSDEGGVRRVSADLVSEAYAPYDDACGKGGALASNEGLCDQLFDQRDEVTDLVDDHALELVAGLLALVAFACAATAHPIVLIRSRRDTDHAPNRPGYRLRGLEVHWASAYVLVVGLVALMVEPQLAGDAAAWTRALGVAFGTLGALLITLQGVGLAAWLMSRRPLPVWYRVFLVVLAVIAAGIVAGIVFLLGVLDMAARPRRKAFESASLPGRGSAS